MLFPASSTFAMRELLLDVRELKGLVFSGIEIQAPSSEAINPIVELLPLALQPTVGFGLSNNVLPFFSYLSQTLSIFSLPALEDLFLRPLSILS